jgi:aminomethyltransferase
MSQSSQETNTALLQTPLHALHLELGAEMVPFAGYAMPVRYQMGIIATLDDDGRFSALIPAAQGAGAMLGPVIGGILAMGGNYDNLLLCVGVLVIISIAGFSILARRPAFTRPAAG